MFLEPIRICRPDLALEVADLIEVICHGTVHKGVPVEELVRILGFRLSDELQAKFNARGCLELDADGFENTGATITRQVKLFGVGVQMEIAPHLRGRLMRFSDSFQMAFEPDHSFTLSKFLFRVELRHLDLSNERIFVDFAGGQDVFIDLKGPPTTEDPFPPSG
jgi:hypothetical protein